MKNIKNIIYLLLAIVIFSSCKSKKNQEETISSYFPFLENTLYVYKSEDSIGNQEIYTTYKKDNTIQQRIVAPNNEVTAVLEYSKGELRQKYTNPNFYSYEDLINIESNSNVIILKEPLKVGTTWKTPNNGESKITSMNKKIDTPLGELETMEITTTSSNLEEEKIYYAKGIGMVKIEYSTVRDTAKRHVVSFLQKIEKNIPMEADFNLYYPDENANSIKKESIKLKINTNENFNTLLEKYIKDFAIEKKFYIIGKNTKINKIEIDREKSIVNLDLSENFVKDMNVGASYENMTLKSIANSLCDFYNVKNMKLTIEGKPYSSGHLSFEENDLISLD